MTVTDVSPRSGARIVVHACTLVGDPSPIVPFLPWSVKALFTKKARIASDIQDALSDAELIQQLADTAKKLGIKIDLNYSFAQQSSATEPDGSE
jgi:hypothetical protein